MSEALPQQSSQETHSNPPGYVEFNGDDGREYLVPRFMLDIQRMKVARDTAQCERREGHLGSLPPPMPSKPFLHVAEGKVLIPPEPVITDAECEDLHEEIKAMQKLYGISYKDAANRLFLGELAAVESNFDAMHAFAAIKDQIRNSTTNNICNPIIAIDKTAADLLKPKPDGTLPFND